VLGLLLILGGGFLLARELFPELRVGVVWPYVVIGIGLALILLAFLRPPRRPGNDRGWR
jgi:threonine/homoserine efflux transporter RhtA